MGPYISLWTSLRMTAPASVRVPKWPSGIQGMCPRCARVVPVLYEVVTGTARLVPLR